MKKKPRLEDRRRESLFAHHNSVQVILLTKHLKFGPSGPGRVEKRLGKGPWAPQGWAVEASPSEGTGEAIRVTLVPTKLQGALPQALEVVAPEMSDSPLITHLPSG